MRAIDESAYYSNTRRVGFPNWLKSQIAWGRAMQLVTVPRREMHEQTDRDVVLAMLGADWTLIEHDFVCNQSDAWIWEPTNLQTLAPLDMLSHCLDMDYWIEPGRWPGGGTKRVTWQPRAHTPDPEQVKRAFFILAAATQFGKANLVQQASLPVVDLLPVAKPEAVREAAARLNIPVHGMRLCVSSAIDLGQAAALTAELLGIETEQSQGLTQVT